MIQRYLVAAVLAGAAFSPALAQNVKAGIEAWQRSDYSAAVAIWRPLAEKGDADAAFNLGQAYRLGRGVPINLSAAKTWFERAASKGHVDAQTTLGLLLFQNGDQAEGLKWLKAAAEQGEPRALLVYGTALFNGDNVTQDPVLGYAYVSRAAAQGLAPAKETLAQLDKILPVADRKKGIALAMAKAKTTPAPTSKRVETARPPKAAAAASPKPAKVTSPVAPPRSVTAASGSWRIQLGAFSQRASAEALYKRVSSNGAIAGRSAVYVPVGAITRLQIGPFASRAAAQAACNALKGQACFPVAGK
jgi:cell division septation protein DedD